MSRFTLRARFGTAVAALAVSTAMLTGCAVASDSPQSVPAADAVPVNIALGFLPNVEYAGNFVADAEGFYAEAGISPTFISGGPNAPAPEVAIASGQADIAFENNTSRLFSYLADAQDIVVIGQVFQKSPNGLLSLEARPVTTAEELNGSTVIAGAPNSSSIDALMALNNVTDYTFVPGGTDVGALVGGQGDALLGFASNQPVALEMQGQKAGKDFYFTPFSDLNYYLMSDVMLVSRAFLEEHRDVVVNFLRASAKGWEAAMKDPRAAAELTVAEYAADQGLDVEQQERALNASIPFITGDNGASLFSLDQAFVQEKVYPSLEKAGLTNLPDLNSVLDLSVFEESQK